MASNMQILMVVDMAIEYSMQTYHARILECPVHFYTLAVNWGNTCTNAVMIPIDMLHVAIHRSYTHMDIRIR